MTELFSDTEFLITLAAFLVCAAIVGYMSFLERRPRKALEPRLIPTTPVLLIFGFIGLLALVHLGNMYGISTGNRPRI